MKLFRGCCKTSRFCACPGFSHTHSSDNLNFIFPIQGDILETVYGNGEGKQHSRMRNGAAAAV